MNRVLVRRGSRDHRVTVALTQVGPAVLHGGLSTLLAFILLSSSESYVCLSFFKIFFLICVFGLYNGLIALPVLLSLAGPVPQVIENYLLVNPRSFILILNRLWRSHPRTCRRKISQ